MPIKNPHEHAVRAESSLLSRCLSPAAVGGVTALAVALLPGLAEGARNLLRLPPFERPAGIASDVPVWVYLGLVGFSCGYFARWSLGCLRWKLLTWLLAYQGWVYGVNSYHTKIWAGLVRLLQGSGPFPTFMFQRCLPKQPIPDLDSTLDRWLSAARHFVAKEEFEFTKDAVETFRRNEGPRLQARLEERFDRTDNYIEDFWQNAAYLANRDPIAINNNYAVINQVPEHATRDPISRAAMQTRLLLEYSKFIKEGNLPAVLLQDTVPLCMSGYRSIFNSVRLPGENLDSIVQHDTAFTHIVVIRKGHYFKVDLFPVDDETGQKRDLTAQEIKQQFAKCCAIADEREPILPVAALTAQNRTTWAKQRELVAKNNPATLQMIETAMFVVCLDHISPKDLSEHIKLLITGRGNDRWFDKSLTNIIFPTAYAGSNVEHSVIDAMVYCTVSEYVMLYERYENGDVIKDPTHPPRKHLPAPECLAWNLNGLESFIEEAFVAHRSKADDLEVQVFHAPYGKGFMKKQRLSPDGYIQMIFQLAYYRMHQEIPKTYEPSTSRLYLLGRTETVHPVSSASISFTTTVDDSNVPKSEKVSYLRAAVKHQTQYRLDTTVGRGCDRHLLALYCASRELGMDVPAIFLDKAWRMPFKLSTSQTPTKIYDYGADITFTSCVGSFGPSCCDGYGISYVFFGEDLMNFTVTSWTSCRDTDSQVFKEAVVKAMEDTKLLFQ